MKRQFLTLACTVPLCLSGSSPDLEDLVASVRADVAELETLLFEKHADAFWIRDEDSFALLLTEVESALEKDSITREAALVQLLRILAFPGDGHTQLDWNSQVQLFGDLPVRFAWFGDEVRVSQGGRELEFLVGCELVSIDGVPTAEALEALRPVVTHANESGFRLFSTRYLRCPGVLFGLGVTASPDRAVLGVRDEDGGVQEIELEKGSGTSLSMSLLSDEVHAQPFRQSGGTGPHWYSYFEEEDAVYVRVAAVVDAPQGTLADFTERLFAELDERSPARVVIDLRGNGGGNNFLVLPFAAELMARPHLQKRGAIVVLIDEQTFSAAINFCNHLQMKTDAVFVGRSPGDPPYSPGDARQHTLPNTGMGIRLSSEFWATFPRDARRSIVPDYPMHLSFEDILAGRDPMLDFALAWRSEPASLVEAPERFVGRFAFSPGRVLSIVEDGGELRMEVSQLLYSGLRSSEQGLVANVGFTLEATEEGLLLTDEDGNSRELPRVGSDVVAPIDALYAGDIDEARELYEEQASAEPDEITLLDNNLATEAVLLWYRTRDRNKARALVEIAVELNPERQFAQRMLNNF